MHKKYGESVHSIEHVKFQEQEVPRRQKELDNARERCRSGKA